LDSDTKKALIMEKRKMEKSVKKAKFLIRLLSTVISPNPTKALNIEILVSCIV